MAGAAPAAGIGSGWDDAGNVAEYMRGLFPMRSGSRSHSPAVRHSEAPCCRRTGQGGIPRPTRLSRRPVAAVWQNRAEVPSPEATGEPGGRKWCRIKAGGRFRAHLPLTPPCNAGRGRGPGWSVWPTAGCDRWSEMKITEEKPPVCSLSQGGCDRWFSQEMEDLPNEKKNARFVGA